MSVRLGWKFGVGFLILAALLGGLFWFTRSRLESPKEKQGPGAERQTTLERPNIIVINIDSLRADHMGVYGYTKNTTPFLDSLFQKGIVFENTITPAYLTFQTDASILSSLYPSQHNVQTWSTPIREDIELLPRILSFYGYKTAGFVSSSLWKEFGWSKQFDFYQLKRVPAPPERKGVGNVREVKHDVLSWASATPEPFFIFWHIYDAHYPFIDPSPEFYSGNYRGDLTDPGATGWEAQSRTNIAYYKDGKLISRPWQAEELAYVKAAYDSGVKYVDEELQLFFEAMEKQPFASNTLVIVSSEHGEDLKEHGFIFHRDLYDVNVRVPLAFIHPQLPRERISELVSLLDIMPTILSLLGVPKPEDREGGDLTPFFEGRSLNRKIFIERPPFDEYAVRTDRWKYILRNPEKKQLGFQAIDQNGFFGRMVVNDTDVGDELYDLIEDPYEQRNLLGTGLSTEEELRREAVDFRERMRRARSAERESNLIDWNQSTFTYP